MEMTKIICLTFDSLVISRTDGYASMLQQINTLGEAFRIKEERKVLVYNLETHTFFLIKMQYTSSVTKLTEQLWLKQYIFTNI